MGTIKPQLPESEAEDNERAALAASYIELARERHVIASDNKIEIDSDAKVSFANDGAWVAAWVWVALPDLFEEA